MGSLKTLVIKTYWKIYNLEEIVKYQQDKKWINKHFCVLTAAETLVMETEATGEVVIVIVTWKNHHMSFQGQVLKYQLHQL